MKIFTALMLAKFFDTYDRAYLDLRSLMRVMLIIGIPVGLIIVQPDFGTAATFFPLVAVAMFFGGIRWRVWGVMALIAVMLAGARWAVFLKTYQKDRGIHLLINVSMQVGVLPTTGIPLPLISYGGSSTMMFLIAIGLMANVDMRRFVNA